MNTPIPLSVRIKAVFARDKNAYWWDHFTNEEKQLRRMDVWELAKVINEARVRNLAGEAEKLIVAEHLLNARLAKIQATASWGSGVLGFVGAIIGAALSVSLGMALQQPKDAPCEPTHASEKQAVGATVQRQQEPVVQPVKSVPENAAAEVRLGTDNVANAPRNDTKTTRQANASNKP